MHGLRCEVRSEAGYVISRGLSVVLIASLVYFIAYPSYYVIGIATGVALAQMMDERRRVKRPAAVMPRARSSAGGPLARSR